VAIPLEGDRELFLSGDEVSDVVGAGTLVEKRRGEFAVRFDGRPGEWALKNAHVALAVGGLMALALLAGLLARAPFRDSPLRSLTWLGAPGRLALLLAPGLATVLVGVGVAFARGDLDKVVAASTLGVATLAAAAWNRGMWRQLLERAVLGRAHRLATVDTGTLACVRGTVRRVADDFVELALEGRDGGVAQADLSVCERLGLGALPHPPLAIGDRIEVIGRVTDVVDPTAEQMPREVSLARRLMAAGPRPLLIVSTASP
jgi:hypothetical protein